MSETRRAFVHSVLHLGVSIAAACRKYGISRPTAYKWLERHQLDPQQPLDNRSTRPRRSPARTPDKVEQAILDWRRREGWGARKIAELLKRDKITPPSIRTITNILNRHGLIQDPPPPQPICDQRFERERPNELWQCDFKGYIEVGGKRVYPFTLLDDHSRYLLAVEPKFDQKMAGAWDTLWRVCRDVGLPDEILCDHGFGDHNPRVRTLSWFESRLIRLGIRPVHGRPYHPQTQGKLERLHGTLEREAWRQVRQDRVEHFREDVDRWRHKYNSLRPHEALGDQSPLSRWRPSEKKCPPVLPEVSYAEGSVIRRVSSNGDISYKGYRLSVGAGLCRDWVRVEDGAETLNLYYGWYRIRRIPTAELDKNKLM